MLVNKLTDIERFGREGRIDETFTPPKTEPYAERQYLRWWLSDPSARDQFVLYRGDSVGVFWNRKKENPEPVIERRNWTESFVRWSPLGTFLLSIHKQGIQLWGGEGWTRFSRFPHPNVNLVDFSPTEKYICTWSNAPIQYVEGHPVITPEDEGKNYIVWEVATGKPLRSFAAVDLPGPSVDENGVPVKKKVQWPAFKWSADDKYVARLIPNQSLSVYELPNMVLLDKQTIKIEGIVDFEWSPSTPSRDGIKGYEQLICYWTPEIGPNPAKVGLISIPSKEIVRTRNLFNVTDCKLHWQSDSKYICCKVDRHLTKRGKTVATSLEIFRVKEKGVPVEVVEAVKENVINFSWEPKGDRFVLITAQEGVPGGVPPKTSVLFFCPEKAKGNLVGNFKLIRTIDKKTSNAIYWSPKGRFVVVATEHSQNNFDLDFYDLDFEGEKPESDKDLTANLQLMGTSDHFGVTGVAWDPTGRYVASSSSIWHHSVSFIFTNISKLCDRY
jgi:translation initiation factor 3 subunit B